MAVETRTTELAHEARNQLQLALEDLRRPDREYGFPEDTSAGKQVFLAKIVGLGPNSEADYSDERYWVHEVSDTSTSETDNLVLATIPVANGGHWVTATNLLERGVGPDDKGTHCIRKTVTGITVPDRYVIVQEIDAGAGIRYIFESHPGQIQENTFAFLVNCLESDCPEGDWYKITGPGFTAKEAPAACP